MKIAKYLTAAMFAMLAYSASAQDFDDDDFFMDSDDENGFHFTTDLVSKAVWRGGSVCSAAFEPEISYSAGGFSVGSWAATPLSYGHDDYQEIDWFMEYAFDFGLSFMLTDYCWTGDNGFEYFGKYKDTHFLEGTLGYDLGAVNENVPLSFNINTMFAGANTKENGDQAYSTYMELAFAPSLKNVDLNLAIGAAIEKEEYAMYSRKGGFNIVNVELGLSHDFNIKDVATLSVMAQLVCNPTGIDKKGEAYALGGVSISF